MYLKNCISIFFNLQNVLDLGQQIRSKVEKEIEMIYRSGFSDTVLFDTFNRYRTSTSSKRRPWRDSRSFWNITPK